MSTASAGSRPGPLRRGLIWYHRWSGVALCLLFAMWFASGAVMHFIGFPALSDADRLDAAEQIDFARLRVTPAQALRGEPEANALRLVSVLGRPVYLLSGTDGALSPIAGDSGQRLPLLTARGALAIAEHFSGAAGGRVSGPIAYDQWIVHQQFDPYRPFYRVQLNDGAGTDLYVSARTGEVRQRTRANERAWNWCGAVIHWIYFTALRRDWSAWNQVVWWLSLAALLTSVAGLWLGIERLPGRGRGLSPYRGWMHWHHVVGLFSGVVVIGWIFSGWLSMDHGRIFSQGRPSPAQVQRVRGMSLASMASATSLETLRVIGPASELRWGAIAGHAFVCARGAHRPPRILWLAEGDGDARYPEQKLAGKLLLSGVRAAWPAARAVVDGPASLDQLYRLAESLPPEAQAFTTGSGAATRIYIDSVSGEILTVMNRSRRTYAWVYYALHTLNFPGLIARPALRTVLVLALLALGLVSSITGIVIAFRRLAHEI